MLSPAQHGEFGRRCGVGRRVRKGLENECWHQSAKKSFQRHFDKRNGFDNSEVTNFISDCTNEQIDFIFKID
jgi:hypothetical protein